MNFQRFFLTFGYAGLSPFAPGTVGSLAAIPFGMLILHFFSEQTLFLAGFLLTAVAIKIIDAYEKESGTHDAGEIVIDEVAGMWLAMALSGATGIQIVLSFVFFRIFDIWKPSIIGRIDKKVPGGLGVMGDDVLAGILAGICSAALYGAFLQS